MRRLLACITVAMIASACAETAGPDDLVRTADDAIKIGIKQCDVPAITQKTEGHWAAHLRGQAWDVSFGGQGPNDEWPIIGVRIRAHDGYVWEDQKHQFTPAATAGGCFLGVS